MSSSKKVQRFPLRRTSIYRGHENVCCLGVPGQLGRGIGARLLVARGLLLGLEGERQQLGPAGKIDQAVTAIGSPPNI